MEGADNAVKSLRCIWISHIHADHHTGLARILALRSELLKDVPHEPLLVIGPRPLKRFLDAYSRLEDLDMQFLDCRYTTEGSLDPVLSSNNSHEDFPPKHATEKDKSQPMETYLFARGTRMESHWKKPGNPVDAAMALPVLMRLKSVLHDAGLEALYSVPVIHCPQAFGIVLKASERINNVGKAIPGWKLVYSGDTRPCQSLVDASSDATVLIHEVSNCIDICIIISYSSMLSLNYVWTMAPSLGLSKSILPCYNIGVNELHDPFTRYIGVN